METTNQKCSQTSVKFSIGRLLLDIALALVLNIAASYYFIPKLLELGDNTKDYYNINDLYLAVVVGIILLIIELIGVFLFIWIGLPD